MKLQLKNVTIWGICWSENARIADEIIRVLRYCQKIIDCDRYLLLSALDIKLPDIDVRRMPVLHSIAEFNVFVNYQVPAYIPSGFAMAIHEDGFPVNPSVWTDEFLQYDYIGAPWPDLVVGNGGFNIESQRLMAIKPYLPREGALQTPSDNWLCRTHRAWLESQGIRFAPWELAKRFSTECVDIYSDSFGYHGRICCPNKYREGWKIIERTESTYR